MAGEHRPGLGDYVRQFFTNWRDYDAPVGPQVWLTLKNRGRAFLTLKGCCGHRGEPGC
jgi:hypothetical protein